MSATIKPVRSPSPAQRAAWRKRHIARARHNLKFAQDQYDKGEKVMRLLSAQVKTQAAILRALESE